MLRKLYFYNDSSCAYAHHLHLAQHYLCAALIANFASPRVYIEDLNDVTRYLYGCSLDFIAHHELHLVFYRYL